MIPLMRDKITKLGATYMISKRSDELTAFINGTASRDTFTLFMSMTSIDPPSHHRLQSVASLPVRLHP
jgi:hypothetical protein